ncbi:MAG TPA: tetratricopeptide repeat protein [Dongiaceae bacterium]|nr:tetratricopeptide repeat protein [Dongiaceae bacterium]
MRDHRGSVRGPGLILAAIAAAVLLQACAAKAPDAAQTGSAAVEAPDVKGEWKTPSGKTPPAPFDRGAASLPPPPVTIAPVALPEKLAALDAELDKPDLQNQLDIFAGDRTDADSSAQALLLEQRAANEADFVAAANLYRHAAANGYAPAQFRFGVLTETGKGVPRNERLAAYWYMLAAEQLHRKAAAKLGLAALQGKAVAVDPKMARLWIGRAADLGDASGLYALSQLDRLGIGGDIDTSKADQSCRAAAQAGSDLAKADGC